MSTELTEDEIRIVLPAYHHNRYKDIDTSIGVHTMQRANSLHYEIMIDLKEAMRETGRKYEILDVHEDIVSVYVTYEVLY